MHEVDGRFCSSNNNNNDEEWLKMPSVMCTCACFSVLPTHEMNKLMRVSEKDWCKLNSLALVMTSNTRTIFRPFHSLNRCTHTHKLKAKFNRIIHSTYHWMIAFLNCEFLCAEPMYGWFWNVLVARTRQQTRTRTRTYTCIMESHIEAEVFWYFEICEKQLSDWFSSPMTEFRLRFYCMK